MSEAIKKNKIRIAVLGVLLVAALALPQVVTNAYAVQICTMTLFFAAARNTRAVLPGSWRYIRTMCLCKCQTKSRQNCRKKRMHGGGPAQRGGDRA